ncbi:unnamed protein product [Calypogeia fissa]
MTIDVVVSHYGRMLHFQASSQFSAVACSSRRGTLSLRIAYSTPVGVRALGPVEKHPFIPLQSIGVHSIPFHSSAFNNFSAGFEDQNDGANEEEKGIERTSE